MSKMKKQGVSPKRPRRHPQKTAKRLAIKMARKHPDSKHPAAPKAK